MNTPTCLESHTFELETLAAAHPPVWRHPHKAAIYARLRREAPAPTGQVEYTRWAVSPLPEQIENPPCQITCTSHFYTYAPTENHAWHVNFADPRLFAAYGSALLAQDELQVLEHPALGSLREALLAHEHAPLTRENGRSTPVLVTDVPRQCRLDVTGETRGAGHDGHAWWKRLVKSPTRSQALYGNRFQQASLDEVMRALTVLSKLTTTHLIAIAAPTGQGSYNARQITDILETAYTGMLAARLLSKQKAPDKAVEVNTGWWGCGAFGGNRQLMALLQMLAARLAGIHHLIFHAGDASRKFDFEEAQTQLKMLLAGHPPDLAALIQTLENLEFRWGTPDGN